MSDVLIELDERRRVSLGKVGRPEHRQYLVHEEPDGTLVLRPAVVMTQAEARLLSNPKLVEQIEQAITDPASLIRRGRPTRKE
jgi:hypothetical protein